MLALRYYERSICECGFHESAATDRSNFFTFESRICPVCRGAAKQARIQAHADERDDKQLGENPPPGASRAADGRRTFVRQMNPLEVARLKGDSVAQQRPGD